MLPRKVFKTIKFTFDWIKISRVLIDLKFLFENYYKAFPNDSGKLREMSLIEEDGEKRVNMAYLAIVGSHAVNGVAAIHSQIIKDDTFRNFYQMSVNLGQENKWQNKVSYYNRDLCTAWSAGPLTMVHSFWYTDSGLIICRSFIRFEKQILTLFSDKWYHST